MKNIIIDIGTKACKILIANKKALSSFTFVPDGQVAYPYC